MYRLVGNAAGRQRARVRGGADAAANFGDTWSLTAATARLLPSNQRTRRRSGQSRVGQSADYATLVKNMDEWWEEMRWLRRHAMAAPFGVFAATLLLTYWKEQGQWAGSASLEPAAGLVDLGAVLYAMAAVLAERGVRLMFWALDERRKWRAKWRAEAREEGRTEGRVEGQAETAQRYESWLAKVAAEKGIALAELLPPEEPPR